MKKWLVIFQKELLEMWRNFKWIWVPITFILLGASEPLATYYMPQLLDAVGGLPEGTIIEIPTPPASQVLFQSIAQYNSLGILIIVLGTMGLMSAERKSGVAELILVKPVSYFSYVTAKWGGAAVLIWTAFFIGYLASWYYVVILFEPVSFADFMISFILFGVWLTFILTISVFFNAIFRSPGVVGFVSLLVIIVLTIITSSFSHLLEWSPSQLASYTNAFLSTGEIPEEAWGALAISGVGMIILLAMSIYIFRKKELA